MRSLWRTLHRATLRDIALVWLADAIVGASFGAIAVSGGLPPWVPIALSVFVFAGGAQFAAVGVILSGGGPGPAAAARAGPHPPPPPPPLPPAAAFGPRPRAPPPAPPPPPGAGGGL